jgi:hypothetical protein
MPWLLPMRQEASSQRYEPATYRKIVFRGANNSSARPNSPMHALAELEPTPA